MKTKAHIIIFLIGFLIIEYIIAIMVVITQIGKCNSYFVKSTIISNTNHRFIASRATNPKISQYGKKQ